MVTGTSSENWGVHGAIVKAIREMMHRDWIVHIGHCYREAIFVADCLATLAHLCPSGCQRLPDPPIEIKPWLTHDIFGVAQEVERSVLFSIVSTFIRFRRRKEKKMKPTRTAVFALILVIMMMMGSVLAIDCDKECNRRCSKAGRKDRCLKYCGICCGDCGCVPSGTYGNKDECPCYRDKKNSKGGPKCP
ncbi:Gibberellin-regulated protein 10 [Striga hermonthica]|uniref:Gibberellin-regulated protein 10 n=1 Tax=Striga hermonthica TaxID=68872 RepID=A0A9N7N6J1_STRHE|nr:Gibberellin-regulated protein 10 [Striga hermonthica]